MPRSRSWSLESRTRSTTAWLARNTPVPRSIASTRVVLPWSTCATSAMVRRVSVEVMASGRSQDAGPAEPGRLPVGVVGLLAGKAPGCMVGTGDGAALGTGLGVLGPEQIVQVVVRALEGARFFEAAMTTLLHGPTPTSWAGV